MRLPTIEIPCIESKLVFKYDELLQGYGYCIQLKKDNNWETISSSLNPLVRGKSFNLYPQSIEKSDSGNEYLLKGRKENIQTNQSITWYDWMGKINVDTKLGWIHFAIEISSIQDFVLQMVDGFEPEITIDMGRLPPYERGHHVWFKTSITNPTQWNQEAYANDFPALYYYDDYKKYQMMMFFNMTSMSWMSRQNIARFLSYRCGFRRYYKPNAGFELGMYADGYSGKVFPKGKQIFQYSLKVMNQLQPPTEQSATTELVQHCLELIPTDYSWPKRATSWKEFAHHCAIDLMDEGGSWRKKDGEDILLPYANGYCPAWEEALSPKGIVPTHGNSGCFDGAIEIAWSLSLVNSLHGSEVEGKLLQRINDFVERTISPRFGLESPKKGQYGSWMYFYYMEKIWRLAILTKNQSYKEKVLQVVEQRMIPLAKNLSYLFPLSFDPQSMNKSGNGDCYGVGGIYAMLMCELFRHTGNQTYLLEAKTALRILKELPVNSLNQEVMLMSSATQAASFVYEQNQEPYFKELYEYLLAQTLRQMYWYDDRTMEEYRNYRILGMFQACTPIIYPAMFENIEAIARIANTFKIHTPSKGLLRIMNHARLNNFYMFPKCLPDKYHVTHLLYIPYENLGILENEGETGWIGQEIYGCGQVFTAYLLWEGFAQSSDKDILVMNLNGYEDKPLTSLLARDLDFLVYNPLSVKKTFTLQFVAENALSYREVKMGVDPNSLFTYDRIKDHQLTLILEPEEYRYLKMVK